MTRHQLYQIYRFGHARPALKSIWGTHGQGRQFSRIGADWSGARVEARERNGGRAAVSRYNDGSRLGLVKNVDWMDVWWNGDRVTHWFVEHK